MLYVDGGTTSNILYGLNWRAPSAPLGVWRRLYGGERMPRLRFWVIINNQLSHEPQTVQPTWLSITQASIAPSIRSSTAICLHHLMAQVRLMKEADGHQAEFRYLSIPGDWRAPNDRQFDKQTMTSLAELGARMGANPSSWQLGTDTAESLTWQIPTIGAEERGVEGDDGGVRVR